MESPGRSAWYVSWRGLAELGRVSNLPTCVSNVLVGFALAGQVPAWPTAALVLGSTCCLYLGGMALNDIIDAGHDHQHARHRPIIAGRIGFRLATLLAGVLLAAGVFLARPLGLPAFVTATLLLLTIVLYDLLHKSRVEAIVLMGLCRGLVYVLAALAAGGALDPPLAAGATSLAVYTALVTLVARDEAGTLTARGRGAALLLPLAVLPWGLWVGAGNVLAWIAGGLAVVWIARGILLVRGQPPRTVPAILTWLGGISLVDSFYLVALQRYDLAAIALLCFAVTVVAHRRILGT